MKEVEGRRRKNNLNKWKNKEQRIKNQTTKKQPTELNTNIWFDKDECLHLPAYML